MATDYKLPPTLIARIIVSRFFEKEEKDKVKKPTKRNISDMLSKSYLIEDSDLSLEIYWVML